MAIPSECLVLIGPTQPDLPALVFVPQAGAGTSSANEWPSQLAGVASVWGVRLPGREARVREAPLTSVEAMADAASLPLRELRVAGVMLFGHCSGALVAYEIARRLVTGPAARDDVTLVVSAQAAPAARQSTSPISVADLPLPGLTEHLRKLGGTAEQVLQDIEIMELLAPAIRADLRAAENYAPDQRGGPLDIPVLALGGKHDAEVTRAELVSWHAVTTGDFTLRMFDAGHSFLVDQEAVVLGYLRKLLTAASRSASASLNGC